MSIIHDDLRELPELTPEQEAELDRAFAELPDITPPDGLMDETFAAVEALMAADAAPANSVPANTLPAKTVPAPAHARRRWLPWAGVGLAAAAAVVVVVQTEPPPVPDSSLMVERGLGERLPDIALKVAVDHDGELNRFSRESVYGPGDTLYFRAAVDELAWLSLVRIDADGAAVFHQQQLSAGEADLALDSGPLAWKIEAGERDAVFAVLATPAPLDARVVEAALSGAYNGGDAAALCRRALQLDARCSAELVRFSP